ncbi:LytR/AlgR family response regulator transcription factor [Pontibacter locisalis]|uniref:LytR/AlgR family response regulator transcription factor n=1 Tax=Pontibacter locisalis TaxID=1719035 RepID=A0ABW5IHW3_9BACT
MNVLKRVRQLVLGANEILLVALLVLLLVHIVSPRNFPFQPDYTFPLKDFLVHLIGTLLLWQTLSWNYNRRYRPAIIKGNFSPALIIKVVLMSMGIGLIIYLLYVPLVFVFVYKQPVHLYNLVVGVITSLLSVALVIIIYLGIDIFRLWKQVQNTPMINTVVINTDNSASAAEPLSSKKKSIVQDQIVIHTGRETLQLPLQQIGYFLSKHKMVFAMLRSGKRVTTHFILSELEEMLPKEEFFRVSRQVIVNKPAITLVQKETNNKLLLQIAVNGQAPEEIIISRYKAAEFKRWFSPNG